MARRRPANQSRPELVKVRVSREVERGLRRLAAQRDVSVSRLCYDALKALLTASGQAEAA